MAPLVYDIGLHNGGDTRQYLEEGCRVIAIDANPAMCAAVVGEVAAEGVVVEEEEGSGQTL